jgi:hypothetical protein
MNVLVLRQIAKCSMNLRNSDSAAGAITSLCAVDNLLCVRLECLYHVEGEGKHTHTIAYTSSSVKRCVSRSAMHSI